MDVIGLIPSFGSLLYTLAAFAAALGIIVAVHEYGHYIVGRWSGIEADVFSLGFGPVIYSRRDRRGTVWQVAALPLGGYVKFRGDANAASIGQADTPGLDPARARETMAGAPLWARAATVAAGPVFNFALSILVFAALIAVRGVASDPLTVEELRPMPTEQSLRSGDEILSIDGRPTPSLEELGAYIDTLPLEPVLPYTVRRDGAEIDIEAAYPYPAVVGGVNPRSAAMSAGLEEGDVITAVGGTPVFAFEQLRDVVGNSDGGTLQLTIWRPGDDFDARREIELAPRRMDLPLPEGGFETRWLIGITNALLFTPQTRHPGPLEALGFGVSQTVDIVRASLSGIYHMAAGAISSCNLSGPIGIAQTSGEAASQGIMSFVWFVAVLSTAVGLLNLFPIPVLDGGHLVFHAWEAATGRPPSPRALNLLMAAGMSLLLTLMIFALANDLFCP